jgi:lipopolysaccharide export system protein LptC
MHLYLPATLMALLALGTWYLVRSTPAAAPAAPMRASARHVDYDMVNFFTSVYAANGQAEQVLQGAQLQHYSSQEVDIAQLRLARQTANAKGEYLLSHATAARAFGRDDGSDMTLTGQVRVQQSPQNGPVLQLQGQYVRVYQQGDRLHGENGVHIRRGNLNLSGHTLDWDTDAGLLTMQQRVSAILVP